MGRPSIYVNGHCPTCRRPEKTVEVPVSLWNAYREVVQRVAELCTLDDPTRRGLKSDERVRRADKIRKLVIVMWRHGSAPLRFASARLDRKGRRK